jgi:hypothetical protein
MQGATIKLPLLNLLHALGLVARESVWPLNIAILGGVVYVHPAVELRLLGGDRPTTVGIWRAMSAGVAVVAVGST